MNKRSIGTHYEQVAKDYLVQKGAKIISTNYHFHRLGEIDIIYNDIVNENGIDKTYLCFGEVKYRNTNKSGAALEAVNYNKRKQICKTAMGFIKQYGISIDSPMRFDVIAIDGSDINWVKNAFYFSI